MTCLRCGEPIAPGERVEQLMNGDMHRECLMRMVIGGVNHVLGFCSCCGGHADPDPPGMTKREAAIAAVLAWELKQAKWMCQPRTN